MDGPKVKNLQKTAPDSNWTQSAQNSTTPNNNNVAKTPPPSAPSGNGSSVSGTGSQQNGNATDKGNDNSNSLVKARRISFQKAIGGEGSNGDPKAPPPPPTAGGNLGHGPPPATGPRPNIKELTNKQRNWFSNFERGR